MRRTGSAAVLAVQTLESGKDDLCRLRIKIARRLVGEDKRRVVHQLLHPDLRAVAHDLPRALSGRRQHVGNIDDRVRILPGARCECATLRVAAPVTCPRCPT